MRLPKTFPGPMTLSLKVAGCHALRRQIEIPAGGEVDWAQVHEDVCRRAWNPVTRSS